MKDQLHAPLVEAFAKQGYHILCEKPMATTIEECVDMVKQVQASEEKKIFGVGHGASSYSMACHNKHSANEQYCDTHLTTELSSR